MSKKFKFELDFRSQLTATLPYYPADQSFLSPPLKPQLNHIPIKPTHPHTFITDTSTACYK